MVIVSFGQTVLFSCIHHIGSLDSSRDGCNTGARWRLATNTPLCSEDFALIAEGRFRKSAESWELSNTDFAESSSSSSSSSSLTSCDGRGEILKRCIVRGNRSMSLSGGGGGALAEVSTEVALLSLAATSGVPRG